MMEWYAAPEYEGRVEITKCGKVRSVSRYVNSPVCGGRRFLKGRPLKTTNVKGYTALQLNIGGVRKTAYIHRLLAQIFIPNPLDLPCVNHIDGNKANNSIENLEWCTHQENMRHAHSTGLASPPNVGGGELCPSSKLNNEKVRDIRKRINSGESLASVARAFSVSPGTIAFIRDGVTWVGVE